MNLRRQAKALPAGAEQAFRMAEMEISGMMPRPLELAELACAVSMGRLEEALRVPFLPATHQLTFQLAADEADKAAGVAPVACPLAAARAARADPATPARVLFCRGAVAAVAREEEEAWEVKAAMAGREQRAVGVALLT